MLALTGGLRAVSMAGNAKRSIRLRSSASAYLSRTLSSTETGTLWNYSAWIKRGALGTSQHIISGGPSAANYTSCWFLSSNTLTFQQSGSISLTTTQVFRDTSSWYHIMIAYDSSQAVASDRFKLYVNGVLSPVSGTYPNLNQGTYIGGASQAQAIGRFSGSAVEFFDGYMAEINFVTGIALTPSSFGEINATSGVWSPKRYTGVFGANGFYLRFSDIASLGKDFSKLGNNWTSNNISVTGTSYDSMLDIPTNNYCTLNRLIGTGSELLISAGNLKAYLPALTGVGGANALGSIGVSSGKWYFESFFYEGGTNPGFYSAIGISLGGNVDSLTNAILYRTDGQKSISGTVSAYGSSYTNGAYIGVAYDLNAGTVQFYKNGVSQGVAATGITGVYFPSFGLIRGNTYESFWDITFGQRPFQYAAPSGYLPLCSENISTPTVVNGASVMAATTYTGTGSALTITNTRNGVSFQPDFVWMKGRSGATDHALYDVVRGTTKDLASNSSGVETTESTGLTAFETNGFTVGALAKLNTAAATYIAWQWKASGAAVSNTAGTITSQVSANQTAGFSVVTYTGTGVNATVGHGLGVSPSLIIFKNTSTIATNWIVYSSKLTATNYLILNSTNSSAANTAIFNNTEPTSFLFSVGTPVSINNSLDKIVAYCFAEIAGFSKFGSYTGNGAADGPFVYCGFKPRFIMVKASSTTGDWAMIDTTRSTFNVAGITSSANTAAAEAALLSIDILANGFKIRSATLNNTSAATYIFAAWAENSIKYALAN